MVSGGYVFAPITDVNYTGDYKLWNYFATIDFDLETLKDFETYLDSFFDVNSVMFDSEANIGKLNPGVIGVSEKDSFIDYDWWSEKALKIIQERVRNLEKSIRKNTCKK